MTASGPGPVLLETTVRFLAELRDGDTVTVPTRCVVGAGKTFRMDAEVRHGEQVCADIAGATGILDHHTRRLVAEPRARSRAVSADPERFDQVFPGAAPGSFSEASGS